MTGTQRKWGVQHGKNCRTYKPGTVEEFASRNEADAERDFIKGCTAAVVTCLPGGEWEVAS